MKAVKLSLFSGLILLALLLTAPAPVSAQEPLPDNDQNCVSCHTHQYYVYDTGKWYCLCEAPMHCVYCHGGRTDSAVKEIAHEGLVLYPTQDQAQRCLECHPEDSPERVSAFEKVAGVSGQNSVPPPPGPPPAAAAQEPLPFPWLHLSWLAPWQWAALGVNTLALLALIYFGYRCWQADCLARKMNG